MQNFNYLYDFKISRFWTRPTFPPLFPAWKCPMPWLTSGIVRPLGLGPRTCFLFALNMLCMAPQPLQLPVPNSAVAGSIQQVLEVRWKLWECKVVILSNDSSSLRFLNHLGKTGFPSHKTQMLPDGITDHRLCNGSLNKISAM